MLGEKKPRFGGGCAAVAVGPYVLSGEGPRPSLTGALGAGGQGRTATDFSPLITQ